MSVSGVRHPSGHQTFTPDIQRGVLIAVMRFPTVRARPEPDGEILHFTMLEYTVVTKLTGREMRADFADQSAVPVGLVLQLTDEFTPSGVTDTQGQSAVLHHAGGFEVFRADDLVLPDQGRGEFMQEVLTLVGDALMDTGEFGFRSPVPRTAFFASGQGLLCFSELTLVAPVELRIGFPVKLFPIGHHGKVLDPHVNANGVVGGRGQVRDFGFSEHRGLVIAFVMLADGDVDDAAWDGGSAPGFEPAELGEFELAVPEFDVAVGQLGAVTPPGAFLLEIREADTLARPFDGTEEMLLRLFEITKGLL